MGYDSLAAALDVLGGKTVEPVTNTPTIFFGRGNDALIRQFMDTEGKAIFETPAAEAPAGDAAAGKLVWAAESCKYCHGNAAEGMGAPKLAGTALTWEQVLSAVRNGKAGTQMQAFNASVVTDKELADVYAWLKSQ
jgi:mono/diheme cytochrome c family protein